MQIELTAEQSQALALLLHEHCRELKFEIAHTDHREYKRSLVRRLEVMEEVLGRLTKGEAAPAVIAAIKAA